MARQRIAAVLTACGALAAALPAQGAEAQAGAWKSLFDGASLDGWIPKIAGHPAGENYQQTFVARDGAIAVSYAGYDRFKNRFAAAEARKAELANKAKKKAAAAKAKSDK